jgi:hypothetical protein
MTWITTDNRKLDVDQEQDVVDGIITQRYESKPAAKRRKPLAVVGNLS